MKENISIFGFDVAVEYRTVDGQVEIIRTSVSGGSPAALEGYDIISHAKEHLQALQDEEGDLFNEDKSDAINPF